MSFETKEQRELRSELLGLVKKKYEDEIRKLKSEVESMKQLLDKYCRNPNYTHELEVHIQEAESRMISAEKEVEIQNKLVETLRENIKQLVIEKGGLEIENKTLKSDKAELQKVFVKQKVDWSKLKRQYNELLDTFGETEKENAEFKKIIEPLKEIFAGNIMMLGDTPEMLLDKIEKIVKGN
jgi:chromosome segregation ATPase